MGTQLPVQKRGHSTPNFRPMSIVAKRSPISATAEHLLRFESSFVFGMGEVKHSKFGTQIDRDEY